jgi:hypothetical protein
MRRSNGVLSKERFTKGSSALFCIYYIMPYVHRQFQKRCCNRWIRSHPHVVGPISSGFCKASPWSKTQNDRCVWQLIEVEHRQFQKRCCNRWIRSHPHVVGPNSSGFCKASPWSKTQNDRCVWQLIEVEEEDRIIADLIDMKKIKIFYKVKYLISF